MVTTMFILDRTLNTSHILTANKNSRSAFWEDTYTQEFDTGAETLEFSCYAHENVKEGNYVAFFYNNQYKMFQITEIEEVHKSGRLVSQCYCETASLQLLNNHVRPFSGDMNCIQFFQHILNDTEWRIGRYNSSLEEKVMTINETNVESVWSLIEDYKDLFECEINVYVTYENGHVTGQYIDVLSEGGLGSPTYKRFEYGRNVTGIVKSKDLYDWCTGIIIDCECDVTDTIIDKNKGYEFSKNAGDVILDDEANRLYNAGRSHVIGVYSGNETDPIEACTNAWNELQKRKEPKFDYEVTTALTVEEYDNIHLGDKVYVVDYSYTPPLLLEARVGKLELSFTDRTQNKCTLTNYKEIKSKLLDAEKIKLQSTVTNIVDTFFPVTSEGIADGAIIDGKIDTIYYQEITADIVSAGIGAFEDLYSRNLTVVNADIENLKAEKADITQLNATNANIGNLQADVADINTLINGNLSSDNIHSLILTSDKVTVADGFIKNAMIDTVSASKINTGTINTNNVQIQSSDGSMIINGTTQQFKDKNGKVRIQIGKDAQGNFTFSLFDANGTGVLINQDGIKQGAIADGLIVNKMVADNANISGGKLDIASVVTSINNGSTTLKGSKIKLDEANQTLDVAFNSLTTTVNNIDVGGRNLYLRTKDFTNFTKSDGNPLWVNNSHWSLTSETYNGCAVRKRTGTWSGVSQALSNLEINKEYTLSVWAKSENGAKICAYADFGITKQSFTQSTVLENTWKRFWFTFKVTGTGNPRARFENSLDGGIMHICGLKLEKGNKPTDWSPAPEDAEEKITSNTTSISAQQGQISTLISNTTITKNDGTVVQLKDDYNSTKSTVSGHTTTIGSLTTNLNSVSSKQTTLETNLEGFKTTVSSTYATKSALNTTNTNVSNLTTKQSSLETNLSGFKTTVSETYATKTALNTTNTNVSTAQSTANTAKSTADTAKSTADSALSKANTNATNISTVTTKQSTLESSLSGFKTSVSETYATKTALNTTNSNVTTAKSTADTAKSTADSALSKANTNATNISTVSSKQTTLETSLNNFKTTVSSTYETKSNASSTYATKTALTQTANDFTFKVEQAGGYNLLYNGNFANGQANWSNWGDKVKLEGATGLHGMTQCVRIYGATGSTYTLSQSISGLNIREPIVASFYRYLTSGTDGSTNPYMRVEVSLEYTDGTTTYHGIPDNGDRTTNTWKRFSTIVTPTSGKIAKKLNFYCYCRDTTRTVYYAKCMVQMGQTLSPWSPNPNEIRDGIVTINNNGITVTQGSDKANLNSTSLDFYSGSNRYSRVKGGVFSFTDNSGNNVGAMGRNIWNETSRYMSHMSSYYGHDIAIGRQPSSGASTFNSPLIVASGTTQLPGTNAINYDGLNINAPVTTGIMRFAPDTTKWMDKVNNAYRGYGEIYAYGDSSHQELYVLGKNRLNLGLRGRTHLWIEYGNGGLQEDSWLNIGCDVNCGNWGFYNFRTATLSKAQSSYTQSLLDRGTNEHIMHGGLNYDTGEIRWTWKETVFTYPECDIDPQTDEWIYTGRNICYIELPIFMAENIRNDYHVNISKMSWGDYRIIEKTPYYFILESEKEDFGFTFEVVAQFIDSADLDHNTSVAGSQYSAMNEPELNKEVEIPFDFKKHEFVEEVIEDNIQEDINNEEE